MKKLPKMPRKARWGLGHMAATFEDQRKGWRKKTAKKATEEIEAAIGWIWKLLSE